MTTVSTTPSWCALGSSHEDRSRAFERAEHAAVNGGHDRRLVAVMFTDMLGYTALIQADEHLGRDKRDRYMSAVETQHDAYGGTIVQRLGDGTMSMFPSSLAAVQAAVAIQRELRPEEVPVRIGLHVGEVIVEPERLTGLAVNIAARIESFAVPGGVMLSDSVYEQIANRSEIAVVELGRFKLKNVGRPFELYAVSVDGLVVPDASALEGKGERIAGLPSNLPTPATPFVGRASDLDTLVELIRTQRVVTITGPGGVGKICTSSSWMRAARARVSRRCRLRSPGRHHRSCRLLAGPRKSARREGGRGAHARRRDCRSHLRPARRYSFWTTWSRSLPLRRR